MALWCYKLVHDVLIRSECPLDLRFNEHLYSEYYHISQICTPHILGQTTKKLRTLVCEQHITHPTKRKSSGQQSHATHHGNLFHLSWHGVCHVIILAECIMKELTQRKAIANAPATYLSVVAKPIRLTLFYNLGESKSLKVHYRI